MFSTGGTSWPDGEEQLLLVSVGGRGKLKYIITDISFGTFWTRLRKVGVGGRGKLKDIITANSFGTLWTRVRKVGVGDRGKLKDIITAANSLKSLF